MRSLVSGRNGIHCPCHPRERSNRNVYGEKDYTRRGFGVSQEPSRARFVGHHHGTRWQDGRRDIGRIGVGRSASPTFSDFRTLSLHLSHPTSATLGIVSCGRVDIASAVRHKGRTRALRRPVALSCDRCRSIFLIGMRPTARPRFMHFAAATSRFAASEY